MKVRTLTTSAGPKGNLDADKIVEVTEAFGNYLIDNQVGEKADADARVNALWPHSQDVPKPVKEAK